MALLRNSKVDVDGVLTKSIALNPETMEPRMVLKAVRGTNDYCTQQEIKLGDIVLMSVHSNPITVCLLRVTKVTRYKTHMSKITDSDLHMSVKDNLFALLKLTDGILFKWLVDVNEPPLLPTGFGWDGKRTRYELAKMEEFKTLLEGVECDTKDDLIEWAMVSPRENVNHQWATAQVIPRDPIFLPAFKNVVYHFVILWKDDGVVYIPYDEEDYTTHPLNITALQDDSVKKALVCTVLSNKYGKNLRWKLYK